MKKKIEPKILIIILLTIILIIMCCIYFNSRNSGSSQISNIKQFDMTQIQDNTQESETAESTTITNTCEVDSALTENIELHATYYLEESYVYENQLVKYGENILKYTNGTYLTAPYDCVITKINIPDEEEQCTNEHYIQVSSNNTLCVQFKVDETEISSINLGQEATVKISALDDKEYDGVVTNISSTASNGNFTVTVEFENDGDIKLGMSATVTVTL